MAYVQGELRDPEDPDDRALARAVTHADSTFEILDLPPGTYSFSRVEAEGMPFALQQVPSGSVTLHLWPFAARRLGYEDVEITVVVEAGGTTDAGPIEARRKRAQGEGETGTDGN
jgi:hypothetical protein